MGRGNELDSIVRVVREAARPVRASEIARELGLERRRVNVLLSTHIDTLFLKDPTAFTWTVADGARGASTSSSPEGHEVQVEAHFAPDGEPIRALCRLIKEATTSILVQAYYLRSVSVADALIRAKKRRVSVRILLGCTSTRSKPSRDPEVRHGGRKHEVVARLHAAGVDVREDLGDTNNHNKCMVIDDFVTVTGGLNFCDHAADNADNMIVIRSRVIADQFRRDWEKNLRVSGPFGDDD